MSEKMENIDLDLGKATISEPEWKHSGHENDCKVVYGDNNERNLAGYGATPVTPRWPRSAKVAINFVINYEEGGEMCTLHGDDRSENLLSDLGPNAVSYRKYFVCKYTSMP